MAHTATYLFAAVTSLAMVNAVFATTSSATTETEWMNTILKAPVLWAAVGVWTVSRIVDWISNYRERKRVRSSLIRSLFAEINVNVIDLTTAIDNSPDYALLKQKLADPHFTPPYFRRSPIPDLSHKYLTSSLLGRRSDPRTSFILRNA